MLPGAGDGALGARVTGAGGVPGDSLANCSQAQMVPAITSAKPTSPITTKRFTGPNRSVPSAAIGGPT